jgi:hypothetical protein
VDVDDPIAPLQRGQFWSFLRTLLPSTASQITNTSTNNIIEGSKEFIATVLNNKPAENFKNHEKEYSRFVPRIFLYLYYFSMHVFLEINDDKLF